MSPKTEQQLEVIRGAKRKAILDAALQEFGDHGYHLISMAHIAKKAGVSKGLLYNYFESKEELVRTVAMEGLKVFNDVFKRFDKEELNDEMYLDILDTSFDAIMSNRQYWRLYFSLFIHADIMDKVRPEYNKLMEKYSVKAFKYFESKGSENPMVDAITLGAAIDGISFAYLFMPSPVSLSEMKESFVKKILVNAISLDPDVVKEWEAKNNKRKQQNL